MRHEVPITTATVKEASQDSVPASGLFGLDDGAVWSQTEPEILARRPHAGSTVTISRGSLGGFFMTIDGLGAGKAIRIG